MNRGRSAEFSSEAGMHFRCRRVSAGSLPAPEVECFCPNKIIKKTRNLREN
jgi:hypothetical protein